MTANRRILLALVVLYAATWATALAFATPDRLILSAALVLPLLWLTMTDLARHEIPDTASATIALAGAVFQWHLHGPTLPVLAILALSSALTAAFWMAAIPGSACVNCCAACACCRDSLIAMISSCVRT